MYTDICYLCKKKVRFWQRRYEASDDFMTAYVHRKCATKEWKDMARGYGWIK